MKIIKQHLILLLFLGIINPIFSQDKPIDDYYKAAKEASMLKNYQKSADICLEGIKKSPSDLDLVQLLGKNYLDLNQIDSARYYLHKVINADLNNVDSRAYLVNLEYQDKRYSSAICYVNELLEITPYSKGLWLKKIGIYHEMGNFEEANRSMKRLLQIFPNDKDVQTQYKNLSEEGITAFSKNGNLEKARSYYLDVIKDYPKDKSAYMGLINIELSSGRLNEALEYANQGLEYLKNDIDLIKKKLGVLEQLYQYDVALAFLKKNKAILDAGFYRKMESYLTHQAAVYYENNDAFSLHKKSYGLDKNKESYDYLLSNSIDKGYYEFAQQLLTEGLKRNPNDKNLLVKQMIVYKNTNNSIKYRKSVNVLHEKFPNDQEIKEAFTENLLQQAKELTQQFDYKGALAIYNQLLTYPSYTTLARYGILGIYTLENNFDEALIVINQIIANQPNDRSNLLKKAAILRQMGDYTEAYAILNSLISEFPKQQIYKNEYVNLSEYYLKYLMENQNYGKALLVAEKTLEFDSQNLLIYSYAINACNGLKQYDLMEQYANEAIAIAPNDVDLKLKLIGAYVNRKNDSKAIELLTALHDENPTNEKITGSLVDSTLKLGSQAEKDGYFGKADEIYSNIEIIDPTNLEGYKKRINIAISNKDVAKGLLLVDKALEIKPNPDEMYFLYRKGVLYEMMKDYEKAHYFQSLSFIPNQDDLKEHLDYLKNKTLKNTLGIEYLRVNSGTDNFSYSIANLYFARKLEKNSFSSYLYYGAKSTELGLQLQGNWNHNFSKKLYTVLDATVGSAFFTKYRFTANVFYNLKKDWEVNLGGGYLQSADKTTYITANAGASKVLNDFWLNFKVNLLAGNSQLYNNVTAQVRYTINEQGDYFSSVFSAGNAPQDSSVLNFQINTFTTYNNSLVGAGYKWHAKHKYNFSINADWYNFEVGKDTFVATGTSTSTIIVPTRMDQYHLYFSIQTKF